MPSPTLPSILTVVGSQSGRSTQLVHRLNLCRWLNGWLWGFEADISRENASVAK